MKEVRRETGRTSALPRGGARIIKIDTQRLTELVRRQPDATAQDLCERLQVLCDETSITRALARLDITLKKDNPRGGTGPAGRRGKTAGGQGSTWALDNNNIDCSAWS